MGNYSHVSRGWGDGIGVGSVIGACPRAIVRRSALSVVFPTRALAFGSKNQGARRRLGKKRTYIEKRHLRLGI